VLLFDGGDGKWMAKMGDLGMGKVGHTNSLSHLEAWTWELSLLGLELYWEMRERERVVRRCERWEM
jgi:hypothetical protein